MTQAHSRIRKTEQRKKIKHDHLLTLNLFIAASVRDVGADLSFVGSFAILAFLSFISRACGTLGGLPTVPSGLTK